MSIDIDQMELLIPHTYKVFEKDFKRKKPLKRYPVYYTVYLNIGTF